MYWCFAFPISLLSPLTYLLKWAGSSMVVNVTNKPQSINQYLHSISIMESSKLIKCMIKTLRLRWCHFYTILSLYDNICYSSQPFSSFIGYDCHHGFDFFCEDGIDEHMQQLHIDGLVQERRNSIANALELHLSCTNPSTCAFKQNFRANIVTLCLHMPIIWIPCYDWFYRWVKWIPWKVE